MKQIKFILLLIFLCSLTVSCKTKEKSISSLIDSTLKFSENQSLKMCNSLSEYPGKLPKTIDKDGKLVTSNERWWTSGFFPGTLWYLYENSKNDKTKENAIHFSKLVENQQYTTDNHDVGFIINCSFGNGYRLTKNEEYPKVIINAAKSLSTRYNSTVKSIRSWDGRKWEFPVIIDNMMNLELLCLATKLSGDSSYLKIAISHANTAMKNHFRPDGSSYHVINYDTITGNVIERVTHQGFNNESAWARGQAWGLYGFTMMYRETKDKEYLKHAEKIANFIISHPNLPKDKIPYWDFNDSQIPNALRDASAGAIIASALVELSTFADVNLSKLYLQTAETQLRSLASSQYKAELGENGNFILKHSVGFLAKNSEVDVPLTYADYYFVEALIRYKNLKK